MYAKVSSGAENIAVRRSERWHGRYLCSAALSCFDALNVFYGINAKMSITAIAENTALSGLL